MATNKFATKLHRSTNKIVVILVYALLEWILIALLLFNSLFYYFIKRFASFFGLKPTCLWCSSLDSLFEPGTNDGSFEGLLCEAHASQLSKKAVDSLDVVPKESSSIECCNVSSEEPQILSDVGSFYLQEAAEEGSSRSTSNSLCNENVGNEDEEDTRNVAVDPSVDMESNCVIVTLEEEEAVSGESDLKSKDLAARYEEQVFIGNETSANDAEDDHPDEKHNQERLPMLDQSLPIDRLRSELESERKARKDLSTELEAERNAAAIAANQTMAMITRLQEEKAAIKMEAVQYQRMMEEQAEYDQEALHLLNELVIKREKEKQELEEELEAYKEKVLDLDYNEAIKEKAKGLCSSSSCSLNDDSEKLSIDLTRELGDEPTGEVLDSVDMVLDRVKNWNMLDGSLEEFEQERVSILCQLKELEEKLFTICDDNANLCSAEVNLVEEDHPPTTMASAAKKLLPMLEVAKIDQPEQKANDKVVAVMKEMDHVYGRLHALEADREFLRHCIGSLNKGDKGVVLLEEILQHLRELRSADSGELMICQQ